MRPRIFSPRPAMVAMAGFLVIGSSLAGTDTSQTAAVEREMQMMDTDRNGKVSALEHETGARQMFEKMDANRDGNVTAAEMDAAHATITGRPASQEEMSSARKINVIDGDKDGVLSAAEHAAGSKRMFLSMDTDRDNQLSAPELLAGRERMLGRKKY